MGCCLSSSIKGAASAFATKKRAEETMKHSSPVYYITRIVRYILGAQIAWSVFGLCSWAALSSFFNILSALFGYSALRSLSAKKQSLCCTTGIAIFCIFLSVIETVAFLVVGPLTIWQDLVQDRLDCQTDPGTLGNLDCTSSMFQISINLINSNNNNNNFDDDAIDYNSIHQSNPYFMFASIMTPVFSIGNLCFAIVLLRIWIKFNKFPLLTAFGGGDGVGYKETITSGDQHVQGHTVPLLSPSGYYPMMIDSQHSSSYNINTTIQNEVGRQVQMILQQMAIIPPNPSPHDINHGPYPSAPEKYPVPMNTNYSLNNNSNNNTVSTSPSPYDYHTNNRIIHSHVPVQGPSLSTPSLNPMMPASSPIYNSGHRSGYVVNPSSTDNNYDDPNPVRDRL